MTIELPVDPLPDGVVIVHAVTVAEVIDTDGVPMLCTRTTDDTTGWQALGLLDAAADKTRADVLNAWRPREDPDQ